MTTEPSPDSYNERNGFKSNLYERTSSGITEYAYVTAGTQDITDIRQDALQLIGYSSQYKESVDNAIMLNRQYANSELTFVGHSLGGGLAAANALATDRNAITFNPAAITNKTKRNLHLPATISKGRIFNVVIQGEIINFIQSKCGLNMEGNCFTFKAPYLPWNSFINTFRRFKNHSIDTIIQMIEEELK